MAAAEELFISSGVSASNVSMTQREGRWHYLDAIRKQQGPYMETGEDFDADETVSAQETMKILVIGAGGLGCEILKDLALSGFSQIHVIDMDTIDVSNLNRQFLFRHSDVGSSKAEVAARFVMTRVKGVTITPHNCAIQDKDDDFYMQFALIVCGLDSIEARRWINAKIFDLFDPENPDSMKPLIDGGTEGLKGQARVIVPMMTSCIECQLDMHAPRAAVPLCTLASIPRQPEHCIEWAHIIAWEAEKPFPALDNDNPEHITWLYIKALERAKEFNIEGVTYFKTQGTVKNIIPAIASTNAIVAAACCNEALKMATTSGPCMAMSEGFGESYMAYSGNDGVYTNTFAIEQKEDCPVCGNMARNLAVGKNATVQDVIDMLGETQQLKTPSVRAEGQTIYMRSPASLEEQTRPNLAKELSDLIQDGEEIAVTDRAFASVTFRFRVNFTGS